MTFTSQLREGEWRGRFICDVRFLNLGEKKNNKNVNKWEGEKKRERKRQLVVKKKGTSETKKEEETSKKKEERKKKNRKGKIEEN